MTLKHYLLGFTFVLSTFIQAQNNNNYNLLWKIEGNGLTQPSYLFGTMHVRDARAFNFSDSVLKVLEHCQGFALEIHPDTMIMDVFKGIFSKENADARLLDLLSKKDYDKLNEKFTDEYGYSLDKLKIQNPYVIKSMLSRSKASSTDKATFVDAYLLGIAKTFNKTIYGLEKTKDQLDFFNTLSDKKLKEELADIIDEDDATYQLGLSKLIDVYSRGNIYDIEKEVSLSKSWDSALFKRNRVMLRSMMVLMQRGSLFTAVGVAHLPGKEGVLQLLKDKGYKVSPMPATFTGVSKNYSIQPSKIKWERTRDSLNGFSIEAPTGFTEINILDGLDCKFSFDLTNILGYGYYAINMQNSELNEDKLIENITDNYRNNKKFSIGKVKEFSFKDITGREMMIKTSNLNSMRLRLFIKNRVLYGLFITGESSKMAGAETERYFSSFEFMTLKTKKDPKWINYSPENGAFSLNLPLEPKVIDREVPSENGTYKLKMYLSMNLKTMTNYLIRCNDFPEQVYADNNGRILDAIASEIYLANKLVDGPDTIWQDGYEGRKFTCFLQGKYYTEARMFLRGNRTYFLLKQNLVEGSTKMVNDDFFNSFTFEPYKKTPEYLLKPENENFEVKLPTEPKITQDSVISPFSQFGKSADYFSTNPSTGGLYQFETTELSPYFCVQNQSKYFGNLISKTIGYSDSIVGRDSLKVNGQDVWDYVIKKKRQINTWRARMWLADNKLFYLILHSGKEELFSNDANAFFNSFKFNAPLSAFNFKESKTTKILQALQSSDTAIYNPALNAFSYYEFEKNDLKPLLNALAFDYKDDTASSGARANLIEAIGNLKDSLGTEALVNEITSKKTNDFIKSRALMAIAACKSKEAYPLYLKLLLTTKELKNNTDSWHLFKPLRDSISFTTSHFKELLPLFDSSNYRSALLQVAIKCAEDDSTGDFIKKNFKAVTKYLEQDVNAYLKNIKNTTDYYNNTNIYYYLRLHELAKETGAIDRFTAQLLSEESALDYYQLMAQAMRIKNQLPINKSQVEKQLKNMDSRLTILQAYHEAGEFNSVSRKYTNPKELGKLILYNYLSEEYGVVNKIKYIGKVEKENKVYLVYKFLYPETKETYLGTSGPFEKNGDFIFDDLYPGVSEDELQKDWKTQALNTL